LGFTDSNEANVTVETLRLIDQARSLTMAMAPRGDLYPYCSAEDCLVTFWRTISLDAFENEVPSIKVSGDKEKYFWEWLPPLPQSWQHWYSKNGHQQITNSETWPLEGVDLVLNPIGRSVPDPFSHLWNRESVGSANRWEAPVPRSNTDHLSTGFSDLKALGNGRFFITEKDYTGLGPPDCQAEDRIAILLGADVPFTLRRCGDRGDEFQLTGETYL